MDAANVRRELRRAHAHRAKVARVSITASSDNPGTLRAFPCDQMRGIVSPELQYPLKRFPLTRDLQRWLDAELAKIETGPGLHPRW